MDAAHYKHGWQTRLFHAALALSIIVQLATSQFMIHPGRGREGDLLFEVHEYSGLLAFVLALALFLRIAIRPRGTAFGQLFPWFSGSRLKALASDFGRHVRAAARFKLPPYDPEGAFPSAIHGLGLLLMGLMATTGTIYWLAGKLGAGQSPIVGTAMGLHETFSSLVWVYVIGHALLALVHHYTDHLSLTEMWSLKRNKA